MEIKEKKIMTEVILSKEEGDFLIEFFDKVVNELCLLSNSGYDIPIGSDEEPIDPLDTFLDIMREIKEQKRKGYEEYILDDIKDYYY